MFGMTVLSTYSPHIPYLAYSSLIKVDVVVVLASPVSSVLRSLQSIDMTRNCIREYA